MKYSSILLLFSFFNLVVSNIIQIDPSCSPSCTTTINNAIASCSAYQTCTVELSAGTFILDGPAYGTRLTVNNIHNLLFTGQGNSTILLLTDISNLFVVNQGSNITFSSFAVDMVRVPFTYGQVTSVSSTGSIVTFDATSLYTINTTQYPWLLHAQGVLSYDPINRRVAPHATDIYALTDPIPLVYLSINNQQAQVNVTSTNLQLNDYVIIRHQTYSFNAFSNYAVTNGLWFTNITLWTIAGMGIYTEGCSGGITINGLYIRKYMDRPMSITADGMHISNTRGGTVTVTNSYIEGQGDDGLNIPTIFQDILSISSDRLSITIEGRPGSGPVSPVVNGGDVMNVFNRSTMQWILSVPVKSANSNGTIYFATPLPPNVTIYESINNANAYADAFILTDNVFSSNRARGALIKTSNVYAARNQFINISGPAGKTETDDCYWGEGHPTRNWTFTDNIVKGVNYGVAQMYGDIIIDNSVPVFQNGIPTSQCEAYNGTNPAIQYNINISNNTFIQGSGLSSIYVYSTNGLTVNGNTITQESGIPSPQYDIVGNGVINAVVTNNVCNNGECKTSGL